MVDPRDLHVPVLLPRVVELLVPALQEPGAVFVDATLGLGGHAEAVLEAAPAAVLLGIDRDEAALELAGQRLGRFGERVRTWHGPFASVGEATAAAGLGPTVRAVLFDFGVSSMQIDDPARGFSYAQETTLDMRMDSSTGPTAADVVNTYPREALARVFRQYGEERFAGRIATAVVRERGRAPFESSLRFAEVVAGAVPAAARRRGHPAKRVFQALRIEVNDELRMIDEALPSAAAALGVGGRIVAMSYHSLEDRRVKRFLQALARPVGPDGAPLPPPMGDPWLNLLTRGAETAADDDVQANPRAASVRLRAAEKTRAGLP